MLWAARLALQFETVSSFDFHGDEYAALCAGSDIHGFQHPIWLDAFYRHLAPNRGARPYFLTARRQDTGALELVLPLILRRKWGFRLLETADLGVSDYVCPVGSKAAWSTLEQMPGVSRDVLAALPGFDLFRIRPVRQEDCYRFQLLFAADPVPLGFSSHAIDLEPPFEDWRKSALNASLRKMIDRKARKLRREHDIHIEELKDPDAIAAAIDALATLRAGRFDGDMIRQDFALDFYRDVAIRGASEGLAGTWRMRAGDDTVAIVFGLTHGGRYYYLLIGCDYERFGRYSPGLQMYDAVIKGWMEKGGTCFDFTIGDEDFKMKFGTTATPIHAFLIAHGLAGRLAKAVLSRRYRRAATPDAGVKDDA